MTELFPPTLWVMAGFPKDGGYFVPHTHINVIVYTQKHGKDPIDLIFPLYQVWKQQQSDPTHADQNICAHYYCLKHCHFWQKSLSKMACIGSMIFQTMRQLVSSSTSCLQIMLSMLILVGNMWNSRSNWLSDWVFSTLTILYSNVSTVSLLGLKIWSIVQWQDLMSCRWWSRQFMLMCRCWQRIWATVSGWHDSGTACDACGSGSTSSKQPQLTNPSNIDSNQSLWCNWNCKTTMQWCYGHNKWCFPCNSTPAQPFQHHFPRQWPPSC